MDAVYLYTRALIGTVCIARSITGALLLAMVLPINDARATSFCGATLPPEIVAQAAALKNDPDLIYEYVYNNIKTLPMYGSLKGPLGTMLDAAGTPVDQAELMASLLQAAGYTTAARW